MYSQVIKIGLTFTFALGLVMSCNDDFLDQVDPNNSTPETFFSTVEALEQGVIASYATQVVEASFSRRGFWLGDFPADDVAARDPQDDFDSFQYGDGDQSIFRVWRAFYMVINRANQVLRNEANVDPINASEERTKAAVVAEARFLRCLYYYYLTMWWGDVPYHTDETLDVPYLPVTTRAEILQSIAADLTAAIPDLYSKSEQSSDQYGRATKGAARTLLARVALVQEDWATVEAAATAVINDDYSLLPELRDIHDPANPFNDESIYELVYTFTGGGNFDWTEFTNGANSSTNKSTFRSFWIYRPERRGQAGMASDKLIAAYDDNDPRLEDYYWGPGSIHNDTTYNFDEHGWSIKKFLPINGTDDRNNSDNFVMFRLADVILMRAEARAMQGNTDGALQDLNAIRERAREGNAALVPDVTATGQAEVVDAIKHERFIELAAEVVRLIDIKRWGDWEELGPNFTSNRDELFPLPVAEIDDNQEISSNNPGW